MGNRSEKLYTSMLQIHCESRKTFIRFKELFLRTKILKISKGIGLDQEDFLVLLMDSFENGKPPAVP